MSDAYAVLSQSETPGAGPLGAQLAEKHLRVFDGKREVAKLDIDMAALPCSIIIDDLDGKPGNEIALIWASIAAGYTMGVTIFDLRENIT
jgi:hypothetical protein